MSKPFTISIHRTYTAEHIEVFEKLITVRCNIIEAEIRDHNPDDEIEILDYTLEDIETFSELHYKGTGKPDDGYVPLLSEQVTNITSRAIRMGFHDQAIREIIIDEYHSQKEA